jgi:hypothetical protein
VIPVDLAVGRRHHHEPNIEVKMLGFARTGRNGVDVEIDRRFDHPEIGDAGLFGCLGQCHVGEVRVAVGVTTGLEPTIQLHMMENQGCLAPGIQNCGRAGEMTFEATAVQSVGVGSAEAQYLVAERPLRPIGDRYRFDLLNGKLEARAHPGNLAAKIDQRFGGEADLVEGGLGHDSRRKRAPQIGPIR